MNGSHGPDYFTYLNSRGTLRRFLRRQFLRPVVRAFSGRVLDMGSGTGEFLELYPDAVGIDLNPDCVAYCRKKNLLCVAGDAYHLPFGNGMFDGVLLNNVLEHLDDPEAAIAEIMRVLKAEGTLVVELPGRKGFAFDKTHVRFWEKDDIVTFLKRHGFSDIGTGYFPIPFRMAGDIFTHNKLRVYAVCGDTGKRQS